MDTEGLSMLKCNLETKINLLEDIIAQHLRDITHKNQNNVYIYWKQLYIYLYACILI